MNFWHAIIFGIVEGVTEFLPISSTGHLMLTAELLGTAQTEFLKSFEIVIQLGAILSVIVFYGRSLLVDFKVWRRILAAFIPTAVVGLLLYKIIKNVLLADTDIVLWALLIGGVVLIVFDLLHRESESAVKEVGRITYGQAVLIGLFQSLAVIPGVSRAAATIIGGLTLGVSRKTIVEFSFLLAVPTMLAASALDLWKNASAFSVDQFGFLATGFIVSFAVALLSIKFLLHFIAKHNFVVFGVYRMLVALVFWLLVK